MSSDTHTNGVAVAIRDVGKCYELYARPLDRLRQTLWRGRRRFYDEFWALRGVSFDLARGESIGIIGRNGSGKSTLLQMIAGTLQPTEGAIDVHGRVAALLELGSGFNPEFTGRENVYLNGAILGLNEREIDARFEEIASFADIGAFLDQPVKTYSTGMAVRLAFAVQVQLEPEIFIVDEALAVGDAAFQIKCMNRMRRLLEQGVSVLLVSHDVNSVRSFCDRVVWLDGGRLIELGEPREVTSRYLQLLLGGAAPAEEPEPATAEASEAATAAPAPRQTTIRKLHTFADRPSLTRWGSGELRIEAAAIESGVPGREAVFEHGGQIHIEFRLRATKSVASEHIGFGFALRNIRGLDIITYTTWEAGLRLPALAAGHEVRLAFEFRNILAAGQYELVLNVEDVVTNVERHYYDFVENVAIIQVVSARSIFSAVLPEVTQTLCEVSPTTAAGG